MAGLYGFLYTSPHHAPQARERLAAMGSCTTSKAGHRSTEYITEGGIGVSGPGIFDGMLMVYEGPDRRALIADGELYHVTDTKAHGTACKPSPRKSR